LIEQFYGLPGVDVVISVVGGAGLQGQLKAVEAAKAAGVKRYIPSEFGVDLDKNP
jgi:ribosomal protein S9